MPRNEIAASGTQNPGITTVRARLSPRLSGATSNGTLARARGTKNDLLRRLLHRPALVDDFELDLTEELYPDRGPVRGGLDQVHGRQRRRHQHAVDRKKSPDRDWPFFKARKPERPISPAEVPPSPESPLGAF